MAGEIERVMQRTRRYWYEDGLSEIAAGAVFMAVGLLFLAEVLAPGEAFGGLSAIGLPAVVVGGGLLARRAVGAVKARLTYPRTGYVLYHRRSGRRLLLTGAVGGVMGALVSLLLFTAPASRAWMPAVTGTLIGATWLWLAHLQGLARFYLLGLASVLAGVAAALAGLGDVLGGAVYFGVSGATLVISGALALRSYLRQSHALAGQEYGH